MLEFTLNFISLQPCYLGHPVAQFLEALRYKPEGRGFIPDCVIGIFHWHKPSGRSVVLGLTQPLTEMGNRNIPWEVNAAAADNLINFMCRLSQNLGASASWNPQGLYRPVMELHYLLQRYLKHKTTK